MSISDQTIIKVKKGLDLKLQGAAALRTEELQVDEYAVQPGDFRWIVPKLTVREGDAVKVGTPVFVRKDDERVRFVSPVSGTVSRIMRGEKRRIKAVVIAADHRQTMEDIVFQDHDLDRKSVVDILLRYGMWPSFIQRPFGTVADYDVVPKNIFISCFDSAPLAPDYAFIFKNEAEAFYKGLQIVSSLTDGKTYLGLSAKRDNGIFEKAENVEKVYFKGPHPAGLVGTQINMIDPIRKGDVVWTIDPQEVAIIGRLFLHRKLDFRKTVALTGPAAKRPHYFRIVRGASVQPMVWEVVAGNLRVISGNALTGRQVGTEGFVGHFDRQVTLLPEGGRRRLFGWLAPGFRKWSFSHAYVSWMFPKHEFAFDTSLNGGRRTIMMPGTYDEVCPLDIMPAELLKACLTQDIDKMEALGIYDVIEEDMALCDVVSPSKTECQQIIHDGLTWLRTQI